MKEKSASVDRILAKLDSYLHKNDYVSAERHLDYWLKESVQNADFRTELLVLNEMMGLYRKLGREKEAFSAAESVLSRIRALNIADQVGSATSFLNAATVYKAFGKADRAVPLFEHARKVYEKELSFSDRRLGGLYNNMALALVDLNRFREAHELYRKAVNVMEKNPDGESEVAVTYLNMASALEAEKGLLDGDEEIRALLEKAMDCLEKVTQRDGNYAFVCEKCASVFGYYGYFSYEKELMERARGIYEGN